MRINLVVPFSEKYQAKSLGARWDIARQVWYVVDPEDIMAFWRWIPEKYKMPVAPKKKKV
jgi:hypothetical protein